VKNGTQKIMGKCSAPSILHQDSHHFFALPFFHAAPQLTEYLEEATNSQEKEAWLSVRLPCREKNIFICQNYSKYS